MLPTPKHPSSYNLLPRSSHSSYSWVIELIFSFFPLSESKTCDLPKPSPKALAETLCRWVCPWSCLLPKQNSMRLTTLLSQLSPQTCELCRTDQDFEGKVTQCALNGDIKREFSRHKILHLTHYSETTLWVFKAVFEITQLKCFFRVKCPWLALWQQ